MPRTSRALRQGGGYQGCSTILLLGCFVVGVFGDHELCDKVLQRGEFLGDRGVRNDRVLSLHSCCPPTILPIIVNY